MATLKNHIAFVVRGIKVFVDFEAGLARVRDSGHRNHSKLTRDGPYESERVQAQPEKGDRQLEQSRQQPVAQGEELAESKAEFPTTPELNETIEAVNDEKQRYGKGLRPGDLHYRAYVGPPEDYDLLSAIQVTLLLASGLRETHRLVDVGCGSLRAGRLFIPYLRPGHYFGIEPNRWLVEEGIERELGDDIARVKQPTFRFAEDFSLDAFGVDFDFAVAQSVFSHTYPDLTLTGLRGIGRALAPEGMLFATFVEEESEAEGSGWLYPGVVPYTWEKVQSLVEESGLVARHIDWMHPRQSWFVASHPHAEDRLDDLSRHLRPPLRQDIRAPSETDTTAIGSDRG